MRLVKDTITEVRQGRRVGAQTNARCNRSTDCRCGQQLDMCASAHCPRCGRAIDHR